MFKFYAKRRRQPRWVRVLFAVVIISFIYLFSVNAIHPSSWSEELTSGIKSRTQSLNSPQFGLSAHIPPKAPKVVVDDEDLDEARAPVKAKSKGKSKSKPHVDEDEGESPSPVRKTKPKTKPKAKSQAAEDDDDSVPSKLKAKSKSKSKLRSQEADDDEADLESSKDVAAEVEWTGEIDEKLDSGLKTIFSIAPDELHVRELLRPIETSGKERLRELGLRARAFRDLLEAWEDIHLVHTKTTTQVRDDIISYLSKVKDLTGIHSRKPRAEIIRSYENVRYFLTKLSGLLFPWTAPYFADHMTLHASIRHGGRGIVLSGGDGQLKYMLTSAQSIRKLGCNLPIEVMYLGDEDLSDDSRSELEALPGVITRDMKQMVRDEGWDIRGWAGKPFAMLLSSFREVIFIDADAMFFVSPEDLFDDPGYEETGSLFFKDRLMFPESKKKWLQQILPRPMSKNVRTSRFYTGASGHMQESGVVVVDKWRHFMALLFVTRMNGPDRDGDKDKGIVGTYDMVYGDKETFWLGWELVGDHDYVFHPGEAGNMGVASEDYEEARQHVLGPILVAEEKKKKKEKEEEEQRKREEEKRQEDEKRRQDASKKENEEKRLEQLRARERQRAVEAAEKYRVEQEERKKQAEEREKKQAAEKETQEGEEAKKDGGKEKEKDEDQEKEKDEDEGKEKEKKAEKDKGNKAEKEKGNKAEKEKGNKADKDAEDTAEEEETPKDKPAKKQDADKEPALRKRKRAPPDEEAELVLKEKESDKIEADLPMVNYTICAPQLLHLDRKGRPLWFNGWILDNKFDTDHPRLSMFESFMLERKQGSQIADWRLEENNLCCLQSDKVFSFTQQEKQALNSIVAIAKEVGAFKKNPT